jgi:hypothetical protein
MKARTAKKRPRKALKQSVDASRESVDALCFCPPLGETQGVREIAPQISVNACPVCLKRFQPRKAGSPQRFCSPRHKLLYWAIVKAVEELGPERLRDLIENLIYKPGPRGSGILNRRLHNAEEKRDVSN